MKYVRLFCSALLVISLSACAKKVKTPAQPRGNKGPARVTNTTTGSLPPGTKNTWTSASVNGPLIAMTFDDGPVRPNTPRLLEMLAQRGIKSTFFTVGYNVKANPDIVRRIVAEGHEIANHTWTHGKMSSMSDGAARGELQRSHEALTSITGQAPRMFRPPYGAITARQKDWIMNEFGYPCIMWSVDPQDWKTRNAATTRTRILAETKPGSIILVHDIHASSIDAMPATLDGLLARGFRFVTVSQLIGLNSGGAPGSRPPLASVAPTFSPGSF